MNLIIRKGIIIMSSTVLCLLTWVSNLFYGGIEGIIFEAVIRPLFPFKNLSNCVNKGKVLRCKLLLPGLFIACISFLTHRLITTNVLFISKETLQYNPI